MGPTLPIISSIDSVDFGFLLPQDIRALSVKRIQNPTTFDTLLHPVPGGLYDSALGAWGDNPCGTCGLSRHTCPGHPGHVELPVPVYHPVLLPQLLMLLRAKCAYCHHLRLPRVEIHRFLCKFRLLQNGLVLQAEQLEDIHIKSKTAKPEGDHGSLSDITSSDESDTDKAEDIMRKRALFVQQSMKSQRKNTGSTSWSRERTEAVNAQRRAVIKEFFSLLGKSRKCASCSGITPRYRKDKFVKIFELSLSERDREKMGRGRFKLKNPLLELDKQKKGSRKRKRGSDALAVDEGIVADVEDEMEEGIDTNSEQSEVDGNLIVEDAEDEARSSSKTSTAKQGQTQRYVNPGEVHAAMTLLFEKETEILTHVYNSRARPNGLVPVNFDMFFISSIVVPPNRFRPEERPSDHEITEAPQNALFKSILTQSVRINQIHQEMKMHSENDSVEVLGVRKRDLYDLQEAWVGLQDAVNSLIDSDRNPTPRIGGRQVEEGVKQKLEKKEGLFRKHMMGKRVNFSARSVISPDPNIETNEIGVPPAFAKKLTYAEPVTMHNFYDLKEAVLNGPEKWPGAAAIENENGQVIGLRFKNLEERQALANQLLAPSSVGITGARNKKVHRHLNNGDIVLMNRQPTLHKPSIMGHRAKVLPGEKTIRMHYANCNTYNADFDGDEMNLHFPQNEIARAEALTLADTDHQYLVATSGKPLRGLVQDHISISVHITNKDTFFTREDYQQLLYNCLRPEENHTTTDRIKTLEPAILKPRPLWTGKQVISTILTNVKPRTHAGLTLTSKSSTSKDFWFENSEEGTVIVKDGEMLCGILDKAQIGASGGGLVHSVYEVYGHTIAGKLLTALGRLLTKYLHMRAFSCGMDDLVLTEESDRARRKLLNRARNAGRDVAAKYVSLGEEETGKDHAHLRARLEGVLRDDAKQQGLDIMMNARTGLLSSKISKQCLPAGLSKPFPKNQMQTMTNSGAKGTQVNANLISCNLGQQVLEGRRVPTMVSGKTLPCFKPFEPNIQSGGYIVSRFLTGISPQEYFFHCMAGREGLIDTAVKTSTSGYLQHCLIKCMEGLRVEYDDTVRDSDGSLVQFLYGEDALDVTKQKHLQDFKFIAENFYSYYEELNAREDLGHIATDVAQKWNKKAVKKVKKTGKIDAMDPAISHFSPGRYPYSTSEAFFEALKIYKDHNPDKLLRDKSKGYEGVVPKKSFEAVTNLKYLKSTVEPGEAVGIVASQSVGEPSTQMTLNTFHLAGHSAKNVTLGIPRLREILMTASANMKTPTMTLHLNPELSSEEGERFAKAISTLSLAEVVNEVTISERVDRGTAYPQAKIYAIDIQLFPLAECLEEYAITLHDIMRTFELRFVPLLQKRVRAELKKKGDVTSSRKAKEVDAAPEVGRSSGAIRDTSSRTENAMDNDNNEDHDVDDDEEDDATGDRQKANRNQAVTYEAPDEEEREIATQVHREASPEAEIEDEGIGRSPPREKTPPEIQQPNNNIDDVDSDVDMVDEANQDSKDLVSRIKDKNQDVTHFKFESKKGLCSIHFEYPPESAKLLMLSIVESSLHKALIQSIPGIGSCTFTTEKTGSPDMGDEKITHTVLTAGVNLPAMQAHQDILDPHKIRSNDIVAMLRHYGVEAARATIIAEMSAVFQPHGISVDNRHLNLIADTMTRHGGFQPFNRTGIRASTSPFLKMSFETTMSFLRDAALEGDWDDLKSPSARIVVGRMGNVGTGAFDVMMPLK
ncbi:MAG: hypothetical protein M1833_002668 [Piccolia ochrophora]|nr:MAG: hypothetical protein M1833_002668 [Piccolia ochrophora]